MFSRFVSAWSTLDDPTKAKIMGELGVPQAFHPYHAPQEPKDITPSSDEDDIFDGEIVESTDGEVHVDEDDLDDAFGV